MQEQNNDTNAQLDVVIRQMNEVRDILLTQTEMTAESTMKSGILPELLGTIAQKINKLESMKLSLDGVEKIIVQGKPGEKGEDCDPMDVADILKADMDFIEILKGEMGPMGPQGPQGPGGKPGERGENGKTPEKGKDYMTEAEINEMLARIDSKIPKMLQDEVKKHVNVQKIADSINKQVLERKITVQDIFGINEFITKEIDKVYDNVSSYVGKNKSGGQGTLLGLGDIDGKGLKDGDTIKYNSQTKTFYFGTGGGVVPLVAGINTSIDELSPGNFRINSLSDRYKTTSTTSQAIVSTGTLTFTVDANLAYTSQQDVMIVYDASNHMHGTVNSYSGTTLVVDITHKAGTGTYASWTINLDGLPVSPTAWSLTGNAGTNPATDFIGTTDTQDLVFRTNNTEKVRLFANGNVGINTTTNAGYKLDVNGTARVSSNLTVDTNTLFVDATNHRVGVGTTSPGNYRLNVVTDGSYFGGQQTFYSQNTNAAGQNTFYLENNRGGFSSYGGFLYGGSSMSSPLFGQDRNDKLFIFSDGGSNLGLVIGTLSGQPVIFGANNAEAARITASRNVLINTTTDAGYKLNVNGNGSFKSPGSTSSDTAFRVRNSADTADLFIVTGKGTVWGTGGGGIDTNAAYGKDALVSNTSGNYNTASGYQSLYTNSSSSHSAAFGAFALAANNSNYNSAFGASALRQNSSGGNNTGIGWFALYGNTTSSLSTAVGSQSLFYSNGANNTAIGAYSGMNVLNDISQYRVTTDTDMTLIGYNASKNSASTLTNGIAIGSNARVLASNQAVLGNDSITTTLLKGNVLIGTTTDAGYKLDVNGKVKARGVVNLQGYTVATLPTGTVGDTAYVTDALTPTFLGTVIGGGAITTTVFYNGTNWVVQ